MVPKDQELRNQILDEAHSSKLSIHLGSSKMYQDLKSHFWWTKMKKEITAYVARCDNYSICQGCSFEIRWITANFIYSKMEVGGNQHGFYCWSPDYSEGFRLNMGNCRPPNQVHALHSYENQLSTASACRNLHSLDSTLAWGAKNHCIR